MKTGDIVIPVHCERSKYMCQEFKTWIDTHSETTFYVESVHNGACRLRKVFFLVTEEFLKKVN